MSNGESWRNYPNNGSRDNNTILHKVPNSTLIIEQTLQPNCDILILQQLSTSHNLKVGDYMGMTNKQFQGFIRLALELLEKALQKSPDNEELKKVRDIFQSMLEDD